MQEKTDQKNFEYGYFYLVLLASNLAEKPKDILHVIRPLIVAENFPGKKINF